MVLVDTSVWVDHFRSDNAVLKDLLENQKVACHPFVIGELACGNLKNRKNILSLLQALPSTPMLDDEEVLYFIEQNRLMGKGLGLIDVHILAASVISSVRFWTLDKRLKGVAIEFGIEFEN
jgi:predicted nucleic acid-binding protein